MSVKIAVDGTAGSGKSTICKLISERLGFVFISTGGFYRSYAYILKKKNLINANKEEQIDELKKHTIEIEGDVFFIDKKNVREQLRDEEISNLASFLAQKEYIREYAKNDQIEFGKKYDNVIMDGRDIGTEIMPDANFKFYFYSSLYERAKRRKKEIDLLNKSENNSFWKIYIDIYKRDWTDKHRKTAPLKRAKDAIKINTSKKSIEEVYKTIVSYIGK